MDRVLIDISNGVADVRLNRPEKRNALDRAQFEAIVEGIDALASDRSLRCVVLSGEGEAFCAGIDLSFLNGAVSDDLLGRSNGPANLYQQAAWGWRALPVPVIAAIQGVAFGGGLQIALGADLRIVSPSAQLSVMEINWGLVPDMAGVALMRGLVRDDVARDLVYSGRIVPGSEAVEVGLATQCCDDPRAEAFRRAAIISGRSPDAIRAGKRLLNAAADADTATVLFEESREQYALIGGPDQREILLAAQEKRAPAFSVSGR